MNKTHYERRSHEQGNYEIIPTYGGNPALDQVLKIIDEYVSSPEYHSINATLVEARTKEIVLIIDDLQPGDDVHNREFAKLGVICHEKHTSCGGDSEIDKIYIITSSDGCSSDFSISMEVQINSDDSITPLPEYGQSFGKIPALCLGCSGLASGQIGYTFPHLDVPSEAMNELSDSCYNLVNVNMDIYVR